MTEFVVFIDRQSVKIVILHWIRKHLPLEMTVVVCYPVAVELYFTEFIVIVICHFWT